MDIRVVVNTVSPVSTIVVNEGPPGSSTATGITETGGPTTLTIGRIDDGQILMRSGNLIIGVDGTGTGSISMDGGDALSEDNGRTIDGGSSTSADTGWLIDEGTA